MTTTLGHGFRPMVALLLTSTPTAGDVDRDPRRDRPSTRTAMVRLVEGPRVSSRTDRPLAGRRDGPDEAWTPDAPPSAAAGERTRTTGNSLLFYFYPRWALTTSLSVTAGRFTAALSQLLGGGFIARTGVTPLTTSIAWLPPRDC